MQEAEPVGVAEPQGEEDGLKEQRAQAGQTLVYLHTCPGHGAECYTQGVSFNSSKSMQ